MISPGRKYGGSFCDDDYDGTVQSQREAYDSPHSPGNEWRLNQHLSQGPSPRGLGGQGHIWPSASLLRAKETCIKRDRVKGLFLCSIHQNSINTRSKFEIFIIWAFPPSPIHFSLLHFYHTIIILLSPRSLHRELRHCLPIVTPIYLSNPAFFSQSPTRPRNRNQKKKKHTPPYFSFKMLSLNHVAGFTGLLLLSVLQATSAFPTADPAPVAAASTLQHRELDGYIDCSDEQKTKLGQGFADAATLARWTFDHPIDLNYAAYVSFSLLSPSCLFFYLTIERERKRAGRF